MAKKSEPPQDGQEVRGTGRCGSSAYLGLWHLPLPCSFFLAHEGTRTMPTGPVLSPRLPRASTSPSPESPGERHLPSLPPCFQHDRGLRNAGMVLENSFAPSEAG